MPHPIVDFHGHLFPPSVVDGNPIADGSRMAAVWKLLTDLDRQTEAALAAGISRRVVSAPLSSISGQTRVAPAELAETVNEALAEAMAGRDEHVIALASVDAYAGDAGAAEARRAVEQLGFRGIVVDAAHGEELICSAVARPTLAYAAAARIPVFVHPVTPQPLPDRFTTAGHHGTLLARGTESALATLGLLAQRVFDELPDLKIVIAGIGASALIQAPFLDPAGEAGTISSARRLLHVDTMGFDPATVRYAIDVVGADRVLIGSDWPIMWRDASRDRVAELLTQLAVSDAEAALISGGNALRLLGEAQ